MSASAGGGGPKWPILLHGELLLLHLVATAAVVAMALAGWWQLDAWRDQQAADQRQQVARAPVPLASVLGPDEPLSAASDAATVEVTGRFAPTRQQFLLPGRAGGSWVVSPLLDGTGSALLVVRGAVPADASSGEVLPAVPSGRVRVTGVLQASEPFNTGLRPGRRIDSLNVAALVAAVPYDLYSAYVVRTGQTPPDPAGLAEVSPMLPDASWRAGVRNLAYAIQWWVFAAFTLLMWWRVGRDRVADHRAIAAGPPTAQARLEKAPHRASVT